MLVLLIPMGSALADQSLYDMWIDYTYSYPEFGGKRKARSHEFGKYIDGCWVDISGDFLLREYMNEGDTAEDLICALAFADNDIETPALAAFALQINNIDAELERSESYSFYSGSTENGTLELYMLDIEFRKGSREYDYDMIVCIQDDYGHMTIEYVVTSGDLSVLGYNLTEKATLNYLGDMFVYYCDEWVSLREEPSTKATRLAKVPKLETVTDCYHLGDNGFVYCNYKGQSGFILWEYLSPMEYMDYARSH